MAGYAVRSIDPPSAVLNRRVPTCQDPGSTDQHGDGVVELQRLDGCTASRGTAGDLHALRAPLKMACSALATRIEEADAPARQRIGTVYLRALVAVA